ncbi:DNA-binding protein [Streptomyces sp. SPB074]|nr:DNA-binding protein [Streptomyces sp. SPB074]
MPTASARRCAAGATASAPRRPGCRPGAGGAPRACAARNSPRSRGSPWTTSYGSNRAARDTRPRRSSPRSRAPCGSTPTRTSTCTCSPGSPPAARSVPRTVSPGVRRLLRGLGDAPASVFAADWTLLWWNPAWAALLGEPGPGCFNLIRRRFPVPGAVLADGPVPVESSDPAGRDRTFVADLRRALARYPGDPGLLDLVAGTRAGNSRFAALWDEGLVGRHREDRKTIHHPEAGPLTLDCDVLLDEEHDQRVVLYTAEPGSREEESLRQLMDRAARAPVRLPDDPSRGG